MEFKINRKHNYYSSMGPCADLQATKYNDYFEEFEDMIVCVVQQSISQRCLNPVLSSAFFFHTGNG